MMTDYYILGNMNILKTHTSIRSQYRDLTDPKYKFGKITHHNLYCGRLDPYCTGAKSWATTHNNTTIHDRPYDEGPALIFSGMDSIWSDTLKDQDLLWRSQVLSSNIQLRCY